MESQPLTVYVDGKEVGCNAAIEGTESGGVGIADAEPLTKALNIPVQTGRISLLELHASTGAALSMFGKVVHFQSKKPIPAPSEKDGFRAEDGYLSRGGAINEKGEEVKMEEKK